MGYDFLRKVERQDAIYGNLFTPLPGTVRSASGNIGNETTIDVSYQFDRHVTIAASYDHFEAGRAVRDAGGRRVDYYLAQISYRF